MGESNRKSNGFGLTLLLILFIGLKLTGFINWSWWWVLSPMLIPLGFVLVLCVFIGILSIWQEYRKK